MTPLGRMKGRPIVDANASANLAGQMTLSALLSKYSVYCTASRPLMTAALRRCTSSLSGGPFPNTEPMSPASSLTLERDALCSPSAANFLARSCASSAADMSDRGLSPSTSALSASGRGGARAVVVAATTGRMTGAPAFLSPLRVVMIAFGNAPERSSISCRDMRAAICSCRRWFSCRNRVELDGAADSTEWILASSTPASRVAASPAATCAAKNLVGVTRDSPTVNAFSHAA